MLRKIGGFSEMDRIIKAMEKQYLLPALELVEEVFTQWDSPEEGKLVRRLVEEIRRNQKKKVLCSRVGVCHG